MNSPITRRRPTDLVYRFFPEREDESKQFDEVEGIANRTDHDLAGHTKGGKTHLPDGTFLTNEHAVKKQTYLDTKTNTHLTPYVIEPSGGVDRITLAFLMDAYEEQTLEGGKKRTVLHLHPDLSPVKVAVIPLARNKPELVEMGKRIKRELQAAGRLRSLFDDSGNIGKCYAAAGRDRDTLLRDCGSPVARGPTSDGPSPRHDGAGSNRCRFPRWVSSGATPVNQFRGRKEKSLPVQYPLSRNDNRGAAGWVREGPPIFLPTMESLCWPLFLESPPDATTTSTGLLSCQG